MWKCEVGWLVGMDMYILHAYVKSPCPFPQESSTTTVEAKAWFQCDLRQAD